MAKTELDEGNTHTVPYCLAATELTLSNAVLTGVKEFSKASLTVH
jgi:hypothetical protein